MAGKRQSISEGKGHQKDAWVDMGIREGEAVTSLKD